MLYRKDLEKFFNNKTVSLVGNSVKLFDNPDAGALIDSSDTVCRFNKGISKIGDPCYGNRMDILFFSHKNSVPKKQRLDPSLLGDTILMHTGRIGRDEDRIINKKTTSFVPMDHWNKMRDILKLTFKQDPSTGIVAIDFVLSFNPKKIILFGFDWKKFPTFYDPNRTTEPHNYIGEEEYVRKFVPHLIEIH